MDHPAEVPLNAFKMDFDVLPTDIDAQNHANNVRVVDWMNTAAVEHSNELGFDVPRYQEIGGIFVVRRHEIDYISPSFEGERLRAYTWPVAPIRRCLAQRRHVIVRLADGAVIARGLNHWVFVDTERGRPMTMPPVILETFDPSQWEGGA